MSSPTTPNAITIPFRNLADMIAQTCATYRRQTAFTAVMPNGMYGSLSFERIDRLSTQFAAFLREELKLNAGDRVALQLPNSLAYPICAFGIMKAGCVLVNTNPLYTPSEMIHQFNDSGAKVLVSIDMFADKLPEVQARTDVAHVVLARLPDLFPALPGFIVQNVLKYWHRRIPECKVAYTPLMQALAVGETRMRERAIDPARYTAETTLESLAALQYTGGTTGVSKGAMLTHRNLLANAEQIRMHVGDRVAAGKECVLAVLPLYHIFAFTVNLLYFFSTGARNILVANPRPLSNLQRAFENYPISWVPGVNTLFNGLLNEEWFADYPPPHLKGCVAGGAALHEAVALRWEKVTKTRIVEGYGLTETSPVATFNPPEHVRLNSIGVPVPGTEITLLNDMGEPVEQGMPGEVAVRGPQVMLGYWQRPDETANVLRHGWLLTGDVAVQDADGYYKIVDRKKDLILVSGFNVYPNEVEDCIAKLNGVAEVAVIGVADGHSGEAVKAFVVMTAGVSLSVEEVREHCRKHLAPYKVPKQVEFRTELPKTPVGKVLRRELRDQVMKQQEAHHG